MQSGDVAAAILNAAALWLEAAVTWRLQVYLSLETVGGEAVRSD
jgi:hypothetical protein